MSAVQHSKKQQRLNMLAGSLKAAFDGWWAIAGLIAASVSAFSLISRIGDLRLAAIFEEMLQLYARVVHLPVAWVWRYFSWEIPAPWLIDAAFAWSLIGGVVLRTYLRVHRLQGQEQFKTKPLLNALFIVVGSVVTVVLWPLSVLSMLSAPFAYRRAYGVILEDVGPQDPNNQRDGAFLFDMRLVMVMQAIALLACLSAWLLTNAITNLYLSP